MAVEFNATTEQAALYTAHPTTASGAPASLDPANVLRASVTSGDPTATSRNATSTTIELVPGNADGDVSWLVEGDADPKSGETFIGETVTGHFTAELAATMGGSVVLVPK